MTERARSIATKIAARPALNKLIDSGHLSFEELGNLRDDIAAALQADAVSEAVDFKSRVERIKQLLIDCREQGLSDYGTACAIAIALHACDEANNEEWE